MSVQEVQTTFFVVSSSFLQCNKKINLNVQIICLKFMGEHSSVVLKTEIQMPKRPPPPLLLHLDSIPQLCQP